MGQEQFIAMMPYISTDLVSLIAEKQNISEETAIKKLYSSKLYAALEKEETKVWQYSTQTVSYTHLDVYKRQLKFNPLFRSAVHKLNILAEISVLKPL